MYLGVGMLEGGSERRGVRWPDQTLRVEVAVVARDRLDRVVVEYCVLQSDRMRDNQVKVGFASGVLLTFQCMMILTP